MNTLSPEMDDMTTIPGEPELGRFAIGWLEEAEIEDMAEPWDKYHSNDNSRVLYPICLGEVLDGRYVVEHKLGFGGGLRCGWPMISMKSRMWLSRFYHWGAGKQLK